MFVAASAQSACNRPVESVFVEIEMQVVRLLVVTNRLRLPSNYSTIFHLHDPISNIENPIIVRYEQNCTIRILG
jgi:hypothetical protein